MIPNPVTAFSLDEQVAVITGASSGLGAAIAEGLFKAGASVVLVARRLDRLEALADRLGDNAIAIPGDVRSRESVTDVMREVAHSFGRVDVLVNAAGVQQIHPAESEDETVIRDLIGTNVLGTYFCAQEVARRFMLPERKGSIVNIASILGLVGMGSRPQGAYCASKSAVVGLTRELAAQWAARGVRVNALAPGTFETEMSAEALAEPQTRGWIEDRTPMRRVGRLDEIIGPAVFLASEAAGFVTGAILTVDGGWTAI